MRPFLPVPSTAATSTLCSSVKRRAAGLSAFSATCSAAGSGAFSTVAPCCASTNPAAVLSPSSIWAIIAPTPNVESSSAPCLRTPAVGAGKSTLALSVSSTQTASSRSTYSPSSLSHSMRITSLTDSPIAGISTSNAMAFYLLIRTDLSLTTCAFFIGG